MVNGPQPHIFANKILFQLQFTKSRNLVVILNFKLLNSYTIVYINT